MTSNKEAEFGLKDHLAELRTRLVRAMLACTAGFIVCYIFIEPIFNLLSQPLLQVLPHGTTLIFTSYPEAFFTYLKLALVTGIFLTSPFILYQIWAFIAPGLYENEKKLTIPFVIFSSLFFTGGGLFGYMFVFPAAFSFLAGYADATLALMPSVSEYFSLTIKLLLGFGLAFELPVMIVFMGLVGIVNASMLRRNRRYAILVIFIMAAILTPTPDIVNQILMAAPLLFLYEFSIIALKVVVSEKKNSTT